MYINEFVRRIEKEDAYLERGVAEDEVRKLCNDMTRENAEELQRLFCYAKAMEDPSPSVKKVKSKLKGKIDKKTAEKLIEEQKKEFEYPMILQEALLHCFYSWDRMVNMGLKMDSSATIEEMYQIDLA